MRDIKDQKKKKLLFFVTEDWYFCSHRMDIAVAAIDAGYSVSLVTRVSSYAEVIKDKGIKLISIKLSRRSRNPIRELITITLLVRIFYRESPDLVHNVAIKPIIYGSIAACITRVPAVVNALGGLGYIFISRKPIVKVLRFAVGIIYRLTLNARRAITIVQNQDDFNLLRSAKIVREDKTVLIKGSGVDLEIFMPSELPGEIPIIILPGRILWDKGVGEFVQAARCLKKKGVSARFVLVGDIDPDNPASVDKDAVEGWVDEGVVEWWGRRDDMVDVYRSVNIVCLPSYREGLPKVLIEAAASARPIVTTDVPGCREVVVSGENGFLVSPRNSKALAEALEALAGNRELQKKMGDRGREKAVREFSIKQVVDKTLNIYRKQLA